MSYDGATGNLTTSISDAGGSPHFNAQRSFAYNSVGQVLTATDPLGIVTQFGYDSFGNQTSIIRDIGPGRLNQLTTISYSAVGDPISITDPRANTTTSTYDAARRLTATTAPNGLMTGGRLHPRFHGSRLCGAALSSAAPRPGHSANEKRGARPRSNSRNGGKSYLILDSLNSTCLRATGSYFFLTSLSVMVREFFLAT